jgi:hypothetical protein
MNVNVSSSWRNLILLETTQCMPSLFLVKLCQLNSSLENRLDTFLELKIENERLEQRVSDLKARTMQPESRPQHSTVSSSNPYPPSTHIGENPSSHLESKQIASSHHHPGQYDDLGGPGSVGSGFEPGLGAGLVPYGGLQSFGAGGGGTVAGTEAGMDDFDEDGLRRKKVCLIVQGSNI